MLGHAGDGAFERAGGERLCAGSYRTQCVPIRRNLIQGEIARIEKKIGLKLPKSYRDFLEAGGAGFRFSSFESSQRFDQFLPLGKIGWLHEEFPDVYKSVMIPGAETDYSSDEDYYHYEDATDRSLGSRDRYLRKILVVGMFAEQGMLLLNPHEVTADGEWEAWEFYWIRTERHLSFAKLARSVFLNTAFDPPRNAWPISDANLNETCAKHLAPRKTSVSP
jgi:SMI1 / KNR4 family (SUKH-1)